MHSNPASVAMMPRLWASLFVGSCLAFAAVHGTNAQIDGPHTEVSGLAGRIFTDDVLDMESASMFSLRTGYYPSAVWGIEGAFDYAVSHRMTDVDRGFDYVSYGLGGVLNLAPVDRVSPFVAGGFGVAGAVLDDLTDYALTARLGGGIRVHLSRNVALRAEMRGLFDGFYEFGIQNLHVGAGVTVAFGHDSDEDRDGITDSHDRCPETPDGAEVDHRGCPYDDDLDGVPNGLDLCPDTPLKARVDSKGCEVRVPTIRRRR